MGAKPQKVDVHRRMGFRAQDFFFFKRPFFGSQGSERAQDLGFKAEDWIWGSGFGPGHRRRATNYKDPESPIPLN